jgi:hypothetical protein
LVELAELVSCNESVNRGNCIEWKFKDIRNADCTHQDRFLECFEKVEKCFAGVVADFGMDPGSLRSFTTPEDWWK